MPTDLQKLKLIAEQALLASGGTIHRLACERFIHAIDNIEQERQRNHNLRRDLGQNVDTTSQILRAMPAVRTWRNAAENVEQLSKLGPALKAAKQALNLLQLNPTSTGSTSLVLRFHFRRAAHVIGQWWLAVVHRLRRARGRPEVMILLAFEAYLARASPTLLLLQVVVGLLIDMLNSAADSPEVLSALIASEVELGACLVSLRNENAILDWSLGYFRGVA